MKYSRVVKKIFGLGSASAVNIAVLSIMSLLIAKFLTVEDFGVTRSITAYMVVLVMLGHFTFHDALASFVARANTHEEISQYFISATWAVFVNSALLGLVSYFVVMYSGLWGGSLQTSLAIVVLFLPFATTSILYNSSLQAVGDYRGLVISTIVNAVIPFCLIVPLCYGAELVGWVFGRVAALVILVFVPFFFIKKYLASCKFHFDSFKLLFGFARTQIFSGFLSLFLLSADIIMLERITGNIAEVAYYGLAAFFAKSLMFVPAVLARIYFKQIASFSSVTSSVNKVIEFLVIVLLVCLFMAIAIYFIGPLVIDQIYGESYLEAGRILKVLSYGVVFMGLWQAISTINIATNNPLYSVLVSGVGSITALILMVWLIPSLGAMGAAWSMVIANAAGVMAGIYLIFARGYKQTRVVNNSELSKL